MGDNIDQESTEERPKQWSWFIEECKDDLNRRRDVYSFGETVLCRGIYGVDASGKKESFEKFAGICLFLPHPLTERVGPLDRYVSKVRNILMERNGIPEGSWLGFDAGPFILPFHPWNYSPEVRTDQLELGCQDFRTRVSNTLERLERPNQHFESRLRNFFSGSGIEPALTLAIASYLSHFCLPKLDVLHLYTAVLFSCDLLTKFEHKFSQTNKAIKNDIINRLKSLIDKKKYLSIPHPFESQALELIKSRDIEEIFLYVHQLLNKKKTAENHDLPFFIDEDLESGPHFFFKFIWKGIPYNKLFLGFLKLKPNDQLGFASDIIADTNSDLPAPTSHYAKLHMPQVPTYKQPEFFKPRFPIRQGCRLNRTLIESKVLSLKPFFPRPDRELNWEEAMLLTCCTPKDLKSELKREWENNVEFEKTNSTEEERETLETSVPEDMQLWKSYTNSNTIENTEEADELIDNDREILEDVNSSSCTDLYRYYSDPLDIIGTVPSEPSLSSIATNLEAVSDVRIRYDIEELVITTTRYRYKEKIDYFSMEEPYAGDIFEEGEEFAKEDHIKLLEWAEPKLMSAEKLQSEISLWNDCWKFRPFAFSSNDETLFEQNGENSEEESVDIGFMEPIKPQKKRICHKNRGRGNQCTQPPHWLQQPWKKIKWIYWRGRNKHWIIDTLKRIDYLLLRNSILKNTSMQYKKHQQPGVQEENFFEIISANHSVMSDDASSYDSVSSRTWSSSDSVSTELFTETENSSFSSSASARDCKFVESAFFDVSRWEYDSSPPITRYFSRSVTFLGMLARGLRHKEEILWGGLKKKAIRRKPPKLYLYRQIETFVYLFQNFEMNILTHIAQTVNPSSSITSMIRRKSPLQERSYSSDSWRTSSSKKSFISRNYLDLGAWLNNFESMMSESDILNRTRLLTLLKTIESFKKMTLEKFLFEATFLEDISNSFRWKFKPKKSIQAPSMFLDFCARAGPIRNVIYLSGLLVRSEAIRTMLILKIEESSQHFRSRKIKHQGSFSTTTSSFTTTGFLQSSSESILDDTIVVKGENVKKKWPKKKEWPTKKKNVENVQRLWLDKPLLEAWTCTYSRNRLRKRIFAYLCLKHHSRHIMKIITGRNARYSGGARSSRKRRKSSVNERRILNK